MDRGRVRELLEHQCGVVSRRQVVAAGGTDGDIKRLVRRREWARVHQGVYVNHTGPLSWSSRAWAAVLFYWPAALTDVSAVHLAGEVIHVAIPRERTGARLPGVRLHRLAGLDQRVQWNRIPPRVRFEDALLMLCEAAATRSQALALLADACQRRRTTPARLRAALAGRVRMRDRDWLLAALSDVQAGVRSVLEEAYLRRVERAHGLPRSRRQRGERTRDGVVYRDVVYDRFAMLVELDGRLGHELSEDRWDDMDRDLLAAVDEVLTLRLGWRHAEDRPCQTAERLARVLASRGWTGHPVPCGPNCALSVASHPHAG